MGKRRASARHACHSWWRPTGGGGIPSVTWPPRGLHPSNKRPPSTHLSRAQHWQASGAGESIRYQRSRGPKNPAPGPQPRFPGEHPRPPPSPECAGAKGPAGSWEGAASAGPAWLSTVACLTNWPQGEEWTTRSRHRCPASPLSPGSELGGAPCAAGTRGQRAGPGPAPQPRGGPTCPGGRAASVRG